MGKGELENQYTKVISYPVKTTCLVKRELSCIFFLEKQIGQRYSRMDLVKFVEHSH